MVFTIWAFCAHRSSRFWQAWRTDLTVANDSRDVTVYLTEAIESLSRRLEPDYKPSWGITRVPYFPCFVNRSFQKQSSFHLSFPYHHVFFCFSNQASFVTAGIGTPLYPLDLSINNLIYCCCHDFKDDFTYIVPFWILLRFKYLQPHAN